jgi:putative transposase
VSPDFLISNMGSVPVFYNLGLYMTNEKADETAKRQETLKAVLHYFYQDNTRSGAHSRYNLKYHLVWITKYRRSFLVDGLAIRLRQIFTDISQEYGFNIIAQEVMPDHVHLLVEVPPKFAPADIAKIFKSISARKMRAEFLDVIRQYIWKEGTLWAQGYYIASVADGVTTGVVKEYIENQKLEEVSGVIPQLSTS